MMQKLDLKPTNNKLLKHNQENLQLVAVRLIRDSSTLSEPIDAHQINKISSYCTKYFCVVI
jgi:hypothetical protein